MKRNPAPTSFEELTMSLEYLLLFGLGLSVSIVLALMGDHVVDFVIPMVKALTK